MEALTELPASTMKWCCRAQCCHLFLQVTRLADITNSAGTHLAEWVMNPKYSQPSQQQAMSQYPKQAGPSSTVWNDFVQLLQLAFTKGTNNKLSQPLGNWYHGRISQAWNQVFSPMEHLIYSFETEPCCSVHIYEWQYNHWSHRWCYKRLSPTQTFPINAVPISRSFEFGFFIPDALEGTADVIDPPTTNVPPWEDQMLCGYQQKVCLQKVGEAIWHGDAIVGTNEQQMTMEPTPL